MSHGLLNKLAEYKRGIGLALAFLGLSAAYSLSDIKVGEVLKKLKTTPIYSVVVNPSDAGVEHEKLMAKHHAYFTQKYPELMAILSPSQDKELVNETKRLFEENYKELAPSIKGVEHELSKWPSLIKDFIESDYTKEKSEKIRFVIDCKSSFYFKKDNPNEIKSILFNGVSGDFDPTRGCIGISSVQPTHFTGHLDDTIGIGDKVTDKVLEIAKKHIKDEDDLKRFKKFYSVEMNPSWRYTSETKLEDLAEIDLDFYRKYLEEIASQKENFFEGALDAIDHEIGHAVHYHLLKSGGYSDFLESAVDNGSGLSKITKGIIEEYEGKALTQRKKWLDKILKRYLEEEQIPVVKNLFKLLKSKAESPLVLAKYWLPDECLYPQHSEIKDIIKDCKISELGFTFYVCIQKYLGKKSECYKPHGLRDEIDWKDFEKSLKRKNVPNERIKQLKSIKYFSELPRPFSVEVKPHDYGSNIVKEFVKIRYNRTKDKIMTKYHITEDQLHKIIEVANYRNAFDTAITEVFARKVASLAKCYVGPDSWDSYNLTGEELDLFEAIGFKDFVEKYCIAKDMVREGVDWSNVQNCLEYADELEYKGKIYSWPKTDFKIKGKIPKSDRR